MFPESRAGYYSKTKGFKMKARFPYIIAAGVVFACLFYLLLPAAAEPPVVGGQFPDLPLIAPKDKAQADYLGLTPGKGFRVPDIRADLVIVEVFSMYCPYCQAEAAVINTLYEKIEADPSLRGRIKLVGIGAGNSTFEVNFFGKKYQVPFPLLPDDDFSIHKVLGGVRTPYFIVVKNLGGGGHKVVFSQGGACGGADDFLKKVIGLGGL